MRGREIGLAFAALVLASCTRAGDRPPLPTYSHTGTATGAGDSRHTSGAVAGAIVGGVALGAVARAYTPAVHIIDRRSAFVSEGGGYALIVLRPGDEARNKRACAVVRQSLQTRLGPVDGRPMKIDNMLVFERPVYWPVSSSAHRNCRSMLQRYDGERASAALQQLPNFPGLGRGPFVIVKRKGGGLAGLFDFSRTAGADFDDQFAAVIKYMSRRADVWSPSFYQQATLRQTLRYYVLERSGGGPEVIASLIPVAES